MRLLLDTHTLLFWVDGSSRLSARAKRAIENETHECFVSLATAWELAIKISIGKLKLARPVGRFLSEHLALNGFDLLSVELSHVAAVETLPLHHGDPFDRLLAAQATEEGLTIVSSDASFDPYGVKRIW